MPRKPSTKTLQKKAYSKFLKVAKKKPTVPPSVKTYVQRTINRNMETKVVTTTYGYTGFNSSIQSAGDNIAILPQLLSGTAQNQRIGESIRPVKLVIRGYIIYRANAVQTPVMLGLRQFVYRDKSVNCYPVATAAGINFNLLEEGGTALTFDGSTNRYNLPHNKEQFQFYKDKKMRVLKAWGYTDPSFGTSSTTAMLSLHESMYHPFTITLTQKQLPAVLKYDPQLSSSYPLNFAPYMAVGYCNLQNATPDVGTQQIAMNWTASLYFKDA